MEDGGAAASACAAGAGAAAGFFRGLRGFLSAWRGADGSSIFRPSSISSGERSSSQGSSSRAYSSFSNSGWKRETMFSGSVTK